MAGTSNELKDDGRFHREKEIEDRSICKAHIEATLDAVAKAMNRFESYARFRDFKAFHIEQAKGFKASLAEQMSVRTKDRLSKATLYATLSALKRFFIWLAGQPGYKSRISYSDAEYYNLSA